MSASGKRAPPSMNLTDLTLAGQETFIRVMHALGFKADIKGVCFGLAHSARDAFLAGDFAIFLQHLQIVQTLYETCVKEITSKILQAQNAEMIEIEKLMQRKQSAELSFEQKNHIGLIINTKTSNLKKMMKQLSDYTDDSDNSTLAMYIKDAMSLKIDVVMQTKFLVIQGLPAEYHYIGFAEDLSSLSRLSYQDKLQKIESILKKLSDDPDRAKNLAEKIKVALENIPHDSLQSLNNTLALFTRIALYQKAGNYPALYDNNKLSDIQTENVRYVHPLVASSRLEALGGLATTAAFTGCYTMTDLRLYFETLLKLLGPLKKPLVLNLGSSNHAVMLGYNPDRHAFVFYNSNAPIVEINTATELAQSVMSAFSKRNIYVVNEVPDASSLWKYHHHYLAVRNPAGLLYVNEKGELLTLDTHQLKQFQDAILNLDEGEVPESPALASLRQLIQRNRGHESLGASVTIITTHVSVLKNDDMRLSESIHQWQQTELSALHEVTAEKMTLTDAADASWFQRALLSNDINTVQQFLKNSASVSYSDLESAFNNKFSELFTLLIPHVKVPLMIAAYKGDVDIVRELLKNEVDINQTAAGLCPLAVAVVENNVPLIEVLLAHGANPYRAYPADAQTPHSLAIDEENTVIVELFGKPVPAVESVDDLTQQKRPNFKHKN